MISPSATTSALMPARCTRPRITPGFVRPSRWLHGSHNSMPTASTEPTRKRRPTSPFTSTPRARSTGSQRPAIAAVTWMCSTDPIASRLTENFGQRREGPVDPAAVDVHVRHRADPPGAEHRHLDVAGGKLLLDARRVVDLE